MNAAALRMMLEKGLSLADAVDIAEAYEEGCARPLSMKPSAVRMRAKRDRDASQNTVTSDASQVTEGFLDKEIPPTPPKEIKPSPPVRSLTRTNAPTKAFDEFWIAYPRKTGKGAARKAFDRAWRKIGREEPLPVLLAALQRIKATWTDSQFIPHPATWLNQERWDDEISTGPPKDASAVTAEWLAARMPARQEA